MKIKQIVNLIEKFAPLELQEEWDNSGWQICAEDCFEKEASKVLLCLSVTKDIINQAIKNNCSIIISHHPLFFIPFEFNKNILIYSAHTNLDSTKGGTTDTLISLLEMPPAESIGGFLRIVDLKEEVLLKDFLNLIKDRLNIDMLRVVNKLNVQKIKKIAFCAGSGADFLGEAQKIRAEVLVTGDIKYHTALDSDIILIDIGHFGSEHPVLNTLKKVLSPLDIEVLIADEKDPFNYY